MEGLLVEILRNAPMTGAVLVALYYVQKAILAKLDKVDRRMDCFESSQHACQLDNAKYYATKSEMGESWKRIDNHESRISRLEGKDK